MSMFKAFMSDAESDSGAPAKKEKSQNKKPVVKKTGAQGKAGKTVPAQKPKPVSTRSDAPRNPNRGKQNIMEKSERPVRQEGRGRGRGRGGHRPGDRDNRGKRYFDRHSGTGRGREAKKSGGGGHNWGAQVDAYNTNVSLTKGAEEAKEPNVEEEEKQDVAAENPEEVEKEPEKETFTLEEWQAKQAEKRSGKGFEELREAAVDKISDGKEYAKKDAAALESEVLIAMGDQSKKQKGKKKGQGRANQRQAFEDIGFKVREPERRGGFRGGRGRGGRGGRGRGGNRRTELYTSDAQSFPALGS